MNDITHRLLSVGLNRRNQELLAQFLGREGFACTPAGSLEEFDTALVDPQGLNLVLVDVSGFSREIWQRCEQVSERGIPLLIISASQSASIRRDGIHSGARGVLVKPLVVKELVALLNDLLEKE